MIGAQECSHAQRDWGDGALPAERGGAAPLPCLNRNNSTEPLKRRLTPHAKKTAFALTANIAHLADRHGIERLLFVTLGFEDPKEGDPRPDPSFDAKEAGRRLNSLQTHVLREMFSEMIVVPERGGKGGRLHYHLLAVQEHDVRTGVDFEAFERGDFRTAPVALRRIWATCREKLRRYGFGGWHQVFPVKTTKEGISKYVGKYIEKQFGGKLPQDKGLRLVRYSRGTNHHRATFSWNSPRAKLWRWQVGEFARRSGCADMDQLTEKFPNWAHKRKEDICAIEPPPKVIGFGVDAFGEQEIVTLWDVWHGDRVALAAVLAEQQGCTHAEAFMALQPLVVAQLARLADPEGTASRVAAAEAKYATALSLEMAKHAKRVAGMDEDGERVDRVLVWNDGRVERIEKQDTK